MVLMVGSVGTSRHPRASVPCESKVRSPEMAEVKAAWSGSHLRGRSSAEDSRVVAVTGTSEVLATGKPEPPIVMGIPEAVDTEIPEVPTTWSGG